jgi:hypothetical protein
MIRRYVELARFLLLVVCLVPFTSTRQAAVACAPVFPLAPAAPGESAPVNEEEDERESETEADGKERLADPVRHRVPSRESAGRLPLVHAGHTSALVLCARAPSPSDPFRNGLGTHYRC